MTENINTKKTQKNDAIELEFTGYANGNIFDSNIPEDLKKISPDAKPQKTLIFIGHDLVIKGLDKALEGKELRKEYTIEIPYKEGFGERKRELVKTIPLKVFTEKKVNPHPGTVLYLDNMLVKVITVSGARVITDFNNPLAGKDLKYKFTIKRIITDTKEKTEAFFTSFFKHLPEFDISEKSITIKAPKQIEPFIEMHKAKFKELVGKDLEFKEDLSSENEKSEKKN